MIEPAGYHRLELLQESGELILYRAEADEGGGTLLVLAPAAALASPPALARLEHEYALRGELDPAWAVCPQALMRERGRTLLLLEDPGGPTLERLLDRPLETGTFLPLAITLTEALAGLHRRGLIHKDLKPAHVLLDRAGGVRLTGFGIASRLPRERQALAPPEAVAGTLAYMSPEQTGRMNRSVDARSDLYALGIMFYRMLTGELPFAVADAMEWVHCHIARQAQPPTERCQSVPAQLSAIVMKLLAKAAEDRYQTAAGLKLDLERCLAEWQAGGCIAPFPPGGRDAPDRLLIPEKLYGREREVAELLAGFDRVMALGRAELVLISGYSGIGKSAVVHELHRALVAPRAFFISGKFDQYRRDIPYDTLAQALHGLARQILGQREVEIGHWRDAILAVVGSHGRLLVDLVPELELVIGTQPPVAELAPREAENRFHIVLRQFLGVFARAEHPLVIFLDDLQWLDAATLKLLEHLFTHPEVRHLLLIGAYRDHEVGPAHPLALTLEAMRRSGMALHEIVLAPLPRRDLNQLIADALRCSLNEAKPLARITLEKSGGNPFFAIQFLTTLTEENLLVFDAGQAAWRWDLSAIQAKGYTDNVVELMVDKLRRLPLATQQLLQLLACLGHGTDTTTLQRIWGDGEETLYVALWDAINVGLLLGLGEHYRFAHDRIQEAAYALIPQDSRPATHLRMARLLLAGWPAEAIAEQVFTLVGQFNQGLALLETQDERDQVMALNLLAARKARAAIAYAAARGYLANAVRLLPPDAWHQRYEETYDLHLDFAESEYLVGNFEHAEAMFAALLPRARSDLDRIKAHRLRQKLYQAAGRFHETVAVTLEALDLLGVAMPHTEQAIQAATRARMEEITVALDGQSIAALADLPEATAPTPRMAIGLLADSLVAVYNARPDYFPLFIATGVSLSLRHGNATESGTCYSGYAVVLVANGEIAAGHQFSLLGMELDERLQAEQQKATNLVRHGLFVNHWRHPLASNLELFERAFHCAVKIGDFLSASYGMPARLAAVLASGSSLDEVMQEADRSAQVTLSSQSTALHGNVRVVQQFVACMKGRTVSPASLEDEGFSEAACLALLGAAGWNFGIGTLHACKLAAGVYYGRFSEALLQEAEQALPHFAASISEQVCRFHRALVLAALHDTATPERQAEYRSMLNGDLAAFRLAAEHCPENFSAWHALLGAELARLDGREPEALRQYEAAITAARHNGFPQYEGLACEFAARFYLDRGLTTNAEAHLKQARIAYARWGADGKVAQLDRDHPRLRESMPPDGSGAPLAQFDILTVVRASQAVSGEIVLDRLIERLMEMVLQHAGADRGLLVRRQGGELAVEAEATVDRDRMVVVHKGLPAAQAEFPESMLHYVARTRRSLILDDAPLSRPYGTDPYVISHRPRSALCLPLVKQGELVGLLYLENRLAPEVFTPARLAVLELLASQAAISIANATLYADLQHENLERQRAELARRESQELLQAIIDNTSAVIFVKDLEGRYLMVNRRYEDLFHVSNAAMKGKTDYDLFPLELANRLRNADRQAVEAGTAVEFEEEVPQDDGLHSYIAVKCPLRDKTGLPYAVCGISTDITEHKQAEAERQARHAAEVASRAKSEFLACMSHELRTPLNAVLGYAQILLNDSQLGPRQTAALTTIQQSGEHLLTLINDLLDLAKVEAGKLELYPAPLDLATVLREVADIIRVAVDDKHLGFKLEVPDCLPALLGDAQRLRQILLNLLCNAVKFTDQGQVSLGVRVLACDPDTVRLRFEVADTGVGLDADQQETIFRPFEQVGEMSRRGAGTGLGLSICRHLVRLMEGDIRVESRPGEGARFHFELALPFSERPVATSTLACCPPGRCDLHRQSPVADEAAGKPAVDGPGPGVPSRTRLSSGALLAVPPVAQMEVLHRLALSGNMRDIRLWAAALAEEDTRYHPLAERLQALALSYQSKAIVALVESCLRGDHIP